MPGARLVMIADPAPGAAARLADEIGGRATTDPQELIADPEVEAVVIAAPARFHADLVVAAAAAGRAVFCEKPMALTLADADRAIAAAAQAGVPLQVGFNRRFDTSFAAAHDAVTSGRVGTPQLLRSLTRDPAVPGGFDPARVPPWTIYTETLIHDFDTLRYLNPGAEVVCVYAVADALARPDWRDRGLLDISIVTIRFDNGAMATAEASFQASYGYDIRGEVFGSAGMVTAGDIPPQHHDLLRRDRPGQRHLAAQHRPVPRRLHRRTRRLHRLRPGQDDSGCHRRGRPRRPGHRAGRHPLRPGRGTRPAGSTSRLPRRRCDQAALSCRWREQVGGSGTIEVERLVAEVRARGMGH